MYQPARWRGNWSTQADLAVVVGDGLYGGAARTLARYDINGALTAVSWLPDRRSGQPCNNCLMCWKGAISQRFSAGSAGLPTGPPEVSAQPLIVVLHPENWRI